MYLSVFKTLNHRTPEKLYLISYQLLWVDAEICEKASETFLTQLVPYISEV